MGVQVGRAPPTCCVRNLASTLPASSDPGQHREAESPLPSSEIAADSNAGIRALGSCCEHPIPPVMSVDIGPIGAPEQDSQEVTLDVAAATPVAPSLNEIRHYFLNPYTSVFFPLLPRQERPLLRPGVMMARPAATRRPISGRRSIRRLLRLSPQSAASNSRRMPCSRDSRLSRSPSGKLAARWGGISHLS